jgi:hypothetical protein
MMNNLQSHQKKKKASQVEKADLIGHAKKLKYAVCKIAPFLFAL